LEGLPFDGLLLKLKIFLFGHILKVMRLLKPRPKLILLILLVVSTEKLFRGREVDGIAVVRQKLSSTLFRYVKLTAKVNRLSSRLETLVVVVGESALLRQISEGE